MKTALNPLSVEIRGSPLFPPTLSYLPASERWLLADSYVYRDRDTEILLSPGLEFDLASVPRLLWPFVAPFELSIVAPLVHDFLYQHGGLVAFATDPPRTYARWEADQVFRAIMLEEGIPTWRRTLAWLGVRLFGWFAWKVKRRAHD